MPRKLTLSVLLIMVLALSITGPAVYAQTDTDGDGLADSVDRCPNVPGPRENGGCPYDDDRDGVPNAIDRCPAQPGSLENHGCPEAESPAPAPGGAGDQDGDGVTDDVDACPTEIGTVENSGCPLFSTVDESQPAVNLQPLPDLPLTGPCVMATSGHVPVNLRSLPFDTAPIVGSMDPQQTYPVYYFFDNPQNERWNQTSPGLAASWVTRLGGNCQGLPVLSLAEGDEGTSIKLVSQFVFPLDEVGFNPQPDPPGDPNLLLPASDPNLLLPAKNFPFMETGEPVLLSIFGWGDPHVVRIGLLLPAVQKVVEEGESQEIIFLVPGEIAGFDPQPDPPGDPGELSGFDPQPDPPGPAFMIKLLLGDGSVKPGDGSVIPVEILSLNFSKLPAVQSCDGSVMPTAEMACMYMNEMGDVAACFLGEDGTTTYCMYGYAGMES